MNKTFRERLSENIGRSQTPQFREAYEGLARIAEDIRDVLSGGNRHLIEADLVPGYVTNLGQQIRVRIRIPHRNWEETFFRAYIPPATGFPVALDLLGEEPAYCDDVSAMEREVLKFLSRPEIDSRLGIIRRSL